MLFTAPSFLFLFLPLALSIYILVPQHTRRYALLLFNLLFYCICTANAPITMLLALLTATFTYSAGYIIAVTHRRGTLWAAVVIHIGIFFIYRFFYIYSNAIGAPYYPFASSIYFLASLSYLIDIYRNDAPHAKNFADLLTYMFFFPVMIVGPIIRYKHFTDMLANAEISLSNFFAGVKRFISGFLKRIAIAAVLAHALGKIYAAADASFSLPVALFCLLLLGGQVYFTLSGYSDMACGMMYMLGMPHKADFHTPFSAKAHSQYYSRFFASLNAWFNDYLVKPILHMNQIPGRMRRLAADTAYCAASVLWLKTRWYMLIGILPMLLLRFVRFGAARRLTKRLPLLLRRVLGIGIAAMGFLLLWVLIAIPTPSDVAEIFSKLTLTGAAVQLGTLYPEISYLNYLLIGAVGLLCMIPLSPWGEQRLSRAPRWISNITFALALAGMLAAFAFAIVQLLPKYPQYAVVAFRYLVL